MKRPRSDAPLKTYFLSYSRHDQTFALRLARDLKAAGVGIWVDQLDIAIGQNWDRTVEAAVRRCEGLIIVLSPRSVSSENVADEVSVAIEDGKHIIPILHEKCILPMRLARVQFIDATSDYPAALQRCTGLILGKRGGEDISVSVPAAGDAVSGPASMPNEWSAKVLDQAVKKLMSFVGPVARVLVQKAALNARNEAELYQQLAEAIPKQTDRQKFLKSVDTAPAAQHPVISAAASAAQGNSIALPPESMDKICNILTAYLGPVARHVLISEAREAKSRDDLYQRLGARIPGDKERAKLLEKLRSH